MSHQKTINKSYKPVEIRNKQTPEVLVYFYFTPVSKVKEFGILTLLFLQVKEGRGLGIIYLVRS